MRIWSIEVSLYCNYLVSVTAGGPESQKLIEIVILQVLLHHPVWL